jgi:hypothetical protein
MIEWNTGRASRLSAADETLDQPKALAIELHALRDSSLPREVVGVGQPPMAERTVAFALVVGERGVDVLVARFN